MFDSGHKASGAWIAEITGVHAERGVSMGIPASMCASAPTVTI